MSAPTAPYVPDHDSWEGLVRLWEELDWPEGCKVEIIGGTVRVAPRVANRHALIASVVQGALSPALPETWGVYQRQSVAVPSCRAMLTPDLLVLDSSVLVESATECYVPAERAVLVAEITSLSTAAQDRTEKPAAYARAGIALYLLIDAHAPGGPTVTLYGEPKQDVYRVLRAGRFGDTFHLPTPFGVVLDTSAFPRP
ncbi:MULTISPECIES: Uma2 family endonuclease [Streptomyces]|uniref:Uma2 family endonuclease n=1 Tax=Streptomyces TaxID=1883 RepID=UPI0004C78F13|nr:Uma2 family endonuclease [Streptomyces sp. NRRL S-237]